jgi:hypothetical protein
MEARHDRHRDHHDLDNAQGEAGEEKEKEAADDHRAGSDAPGPES